MTNITFNKQIILMMAVLLTQSFFSLNLNAASIPAVIVNETISQTCDGTAYTPYSNGGSLVQLYSSSGNNIACSDSLSTPNITDNGNPCTYWGHASGAGGYVISSWQCFPTNGTNIYFKQHTVAIKTPITTTTKSCPDPQYPNPINNGDDCEDTIVANCTQSINFPLASGLGNNNKVCIQDELGASGDYCSFGISEFQPNVDFVRFIPTYSACNCNTDICTDTPTVDNPTSDNPLTNNPPDITPTPDPADPDPVDPNPTDPTDVGRLLPVLEQIENNIDQSEGLNRVQNDLLNDVRNRISQTNQNLDNIRNSATQMNANLNDIKGLLENPTDPDPTPSCPTGFFAASDGQCFAEHLSTTPTTYGDYKTTEAGVEVALEEQKLITAYNDISTSLTNTFTVNFPSGTYSTNIVSIRGQNVDFGIGRIMQYFNLGALFPTIASILAFFIVFGRR